MFYYHTVLKTKKIHQVVSTNCKKLKIIGMECLPKTFCHKNFVKLLEVYLTLKFGGVV